MGDFNLTGNIQSFSIENMRFYYTDGEITDGPLTEDELVTDYVNGALGDNVKVRRENSETWLPIRSVLMQIKMKSSANKKRQDEEEEIPDDGEPEAVAPPAGNIIQAISCIILAFIAAVVLVQFNQIEKPKPPAEYEYASIKVNAEDLFRSDIVRGQEDLGMVQCGALLGLPEGWEYVSTLCPDGDKAAWVLVRRLRPEKPENDKINS